VRLLDAAASPVESDSRAFTDAALADLRADAVASPSARHDATTLEGNHRQAPSAAFTLAVLVGATAWVALATIVRLPVSTTHALIGALIGAGLLFAPDAVRWHALGAPLVAPLLLSVGVAYAMSFVLNAIPGRVPECVCVGANAA
jgi:phosphate/sulfate permease